MGITRTQSTSINLKFHAFRNEDVVADACGWLRSARLASRGVGAKWPRSARLASFGTGPGPRPPSPLRDAKERRDVALPVHHRGAGGSRPAIPARHPMDRCNEGGCSGWPCPMADPARVSGCSKQGYGASEVDEGPGAPARPGEGQAFESAIPPFRPRVRRGIQPAGGSQANPSHPPAASRLMGHGVARSPDKARVREVMGRRGVENGQFFLRSPNRPRIIYEMLFRGCPRRLTGRER
jgi:hypothetical protein